MHGKCLQTLIFKVFLQMFHHQHKMYAINDNDPRK